ncbi:MAG: clostripain-related cysteine peptidase [Elusimicrobia bacterium]|nr:clostripain-related cysteine peptidase [Elusimicrobiota bacterium]
MKKNILLALAVVAALALGLGAQDISFDKLYSGGTGLSAAPVSMPVPVAAAAAEAPAPATAPAEREWLVLVFINGRNNLAPAAIMDVNEMETVGSTDKVAVTAELGVVNDRGTSARFLIEKDTRFPIANMVDGDDDLTHIISNGIKVPNADMGSWKHFADFAKWSIKKYPAKRVMAVLWNHGSGRKDIGGADNSGAELGIAYDDTTRNFIRNKQIAMALAEIARSTGKKVDLYASDACLMQMASVAYELKDKTDVVVGAEEIVPGNGFPYDTILQALNSNPGADAEGLGRIIVEKFHDFYDANQASTLNANEGTTISAIRTSQLDGFVQLLNAWVNEAKKPENAAVFKPAISGTLSFEYNNKGPDDGYSARSKDLYDFIKQINANPKVSPALKAKGQAVQRFISGSLLIANANTGPNGDYTRAMGLAVYFPQMIYDSSYDETRFAADSLWDDFIKLMLTRQQK